ncbi:MAG: hypothetical protein J1F18_15000, partial [Lachnospiraceae bacterium]|nr:hypothetical protein [Lachnospiraceae bacterium]
MYELRSARPSPDWRKSGQFASLRSEQGAAPLAPLKRLSLVKLPSTNGFDKPFAVSKFYDKIEKP